MGTGIEKDRAIQAADLIISGNTVATVAVGILSNYLRIIELDNTRSNRCSISEKWNRFIDGISSYAYTAGTGKNT